MTRRAWIIGAGPVGLTLAHLLQARGFEIELFEKRSQGPAQSMAIGITPPSLEIFSRIGLRNILEQRGIAIQQARVYENRQWVGTLSFQSAGGHILSLPQAQTVEILRKSLSNRPGVILHENHAFTADSPLPENRIPVIGCDGHHSTVRSRAEIPVRTRLYPQQFFMADFEDIEQAGPDARLFFSAKGSVESFPLPGGLRRWVAQVLPGQTADIPQLITRVQDAANVDLTDVPFSSPSPFQPRRVLASRFVSPPFLLCGDAAHQLSPIGGQGMNTGLADAWHLAAALDHESPEALKTWERQRKKAFRHASARAVLGMNLGTWTGSAGSRLRAMIIRRLLTQSFTVHTLSRSYAMLNLPNPVIR